LQVYRFAAGRAVSAPAEAHMVAAPSEVVTSPGAVARRQSLEVPDGP
jgi:hypothetical protein